MSEIKNALLALTTIGPSYGLKYREELDNRGGRLINSGQVYQTLDRLSRDGLIAAVGETSDGVTLFAATAAGRSVAAEWLARPLPGFDEMVMQVRISLSLPDHCSQRLIAASIAKWRAEFVDAERGSAATVTDLGAAARRLQAGAAVEWLEFASRVSDAGWRIDSQRPKKGRRKLSAATP